jgi:hypothetical protein
MCYCNGRRVQITLFVAPLVDSLEVWSCMPMHQWKLLPLLPALKSLKIWMCNELSCSSEITRSLGSLEILKLKHCWESHELPQWMGGLTSLRVLKLTHCKNIHALPEWLGGLVSLEELVIKGCGEHRVSSGKHTAAHQFKRSDGSGVP